MVTDFGFDGFGKSANQRHQARVSARAIAALSKGHRLTMSQVEVPSCHVSHLSSFSLSPQELAAGLPNQTIGLRLKGSTALESPAAVPVCYGTSELTRFSVRVLANRVSHEVLAPLSLVSSREDGTSGELFGSEL